MLGIDDAIEYLEREHDIAVLEVQDGKYYQDGVLMTEAEVIDEAKKLRGDT